MCLRDQLKSFGVIWDHLESFKSCGNNICYTIDTVILRFWAGLNLNFVKDIQGEMQINGEIKIDSLTP